MFDKILIANRGEIACRVIKTARSLGVRTVAVYSDADANALHVAQADQAVRLGPAPVADSYLRGDLIIAAAIETGAQAIHPGYGFLSENPEFVDAVTDAGLVFIGPSADAMRAMGFKGAAKALMAKAGVPVVPGYHGADQDAAHLAREAEKIGYPVLIKAIAGGGGKGMRLVNAPADFADHLTAAQSEGRNAFGNGDVLIEKYIATPRHIEVQIFGDGVDVVHLFERDCSLQRRHQKVIEEAPAPCMPKEVRAAMCDAAVKAAKAIGYAGAGTVEFIADASNGLRADGFWFMEMNTRLQVEHPVTEAITGIDLVAWQLQVAAGAPLPAKQSDIYITGHAFEARLYAEDVPAGFLPAVGPLDHLAFAQGVRVDCGVRQGDDVTPWYDPMIAKIIGHGPDRDTALRRLRAGLDGTQIAGCITNLGFLRRLARDHGFGQGNVDTGLIARHAQTLTVDPPPEGQEVAIAVASIACVDTRTLSGFTLWAPLTQTMTLQQSDTEFAIRLRATGSTRCAVEVDDQWYDLHRRDDHWGLPAHVKGKQVTVFGQQPQSFTLRDPLDRMATTIAGDTILAPMPGLLLQVTVQAGDTVKAGDRVAVLEAMKMEHVLRAPRDGVLATVQVSQGDQITAGATIATLAP